MIFFRTDSDIFLPYYYFLKILDNPSRLHPVAMYSISDVGLTKRAQLLANNYEESDSIGIFTLPAKPNTDYAKSKARFALWYVSNCQTKGTKKRMEIVKELRKHISIDVYGSNECSEVGAEPDPCDNDETCSSQLMSAYKFYLSFENTQCNYYITGICSFIYVIILYSHFLASFTSLSLSLHIYTLQVIDWFVTSITNATFQNNLNIDLFFFL